MQRWKKDLLLFPVGGAGYGMIELLWRGRTHWSMLMAGGTCFLIMVHVEKRGCCWPRLCRAAACALGITTVELIYGIVFNLLLQKNVWDYSEQPLNFMGQICLGYTVLWGLLSLAALPLAGKLDRLLEQKSPRPH